MATSTRKRASTAAQKRKKAKPKDTKATLQAKKQMWAVVIFAAGLLLAFMTLIEGEKAWRAIHHFLFGIFGWGVYFLAPLMIYIAVIAARDRPLSAIRAKLLQLTGLIIVISGAIQIFGPGLPDYGTFVDNFLALYEDGVMRRGGGVAGAVFAYPLIGLAGAVGARIIIVLFIFVFVMLITGSSLVSLYQHLRRPVEGLEEAYVEAVASQGQKEKTDKPGKSEKGGKTKKQAPSKFNIDVDIDGDFKPGEADTDIIGQVPAAPAAGEPPLPGHPVVIPQTDRREPVLFSLDDKPVEYVSPEEFAAQEAEEEIPAPKRPAARSHPLEEEIRSAEENAEQEDEIGEVIGRFLSSQPAEDPEPIPTIPAEAGQRVEDPPPASPEAPPKPPVYRHPPVSLLSVIKSAKDKDISEELKGNAQTLVDTLKSFGVQTRITDICRGPAVTRYELQPSAGVKISKITGLADDIALNLASAGIRIEAPIPNKAAVGIEVPNKIVSMVSIREIIDSREFTNAGSSLTVALGKDIAGNITMADLGKMPHVLIAGATGSGKSVCINSIIVSLLYKSSPEEVKLLMVDPKVVELGIYNGIPHLLVPVVTDPKKAAGALNWAVTEMLKRYKTFADNAVRDIAGYNRLAEKSEELESMPKIVIIIDELADLMMAAPGDVEDAICRLAQMARAAGMHLVIATQRPSVDVITGVIKANIPSRVAFAVSSMVDSRTILDMGGAEKLLGRGDMLFYPVGAGKPVRVQGCFVTDGEVEKVVEFVKQGETAAYDQDIVEDIERHVVAEKGGKNKNDGGGFDDEDDMLPQAIECVIEMGQASTSALQRRLKLGYARAARIIDQLEQKGIVGPFEGSKPRQVLISKDMWLERKLSGAEDAVLQQSGGDAPFDL